MSKPPKRLPERIGYARVSTLDQDPERQIKALEEAGCHAIYADRVSGARRNRPQLEKALEYLQADDTLVVWKLDRPARSLQHLIEIVTSLDKREVELQSLTQGINTRTPSGRMIFGIMGVLAEFERELMSERTKLAALRRKEKNERWGRPSIFHNPATVRIAKTLLRNPNLTKVEIASELGIKVACLYKWFPGGDPKRFGEGRVLPPPPTRKEPVRGIKKTLPEKR